MLTQKRNHAFVTLKTYDIHILIVCICQILYQNCERSAVYYIHQNFLRRYIEIPHVTIEAPSYET